MHREFGPRGLTVVAVNIHEDRTTVASWVKANGITSAVLLDRDRAATAAYEVHGTPTVVLIGRDGRMVGKAVGPRDWLGERGRALLVALLAPAGR